MQKPGRDYKGNAWMQFCFIENGGAAPKPPHIFQTAGSLFFASMQKKTSEQPIRRRFSSGKSRVC